MCGYIMNDMRGLLVYEVVYKEHYEVFVFFGLFVSREVVSDVCKKVVGLNVIIDLFCGEFVVVECFF